MQMILMTTSPWGLFKEYQGIFIAEMSVLLSAVLVIRVMTVGLLLSMILTEVPDDIYDDDDDDDDDDDYDLGLSIY